MHRRTPIAVVLGALVAIVLLPGTALAIPIHRHITTEKPDGHSITTVVVYHVAPADSDEDGVANADDDCIHDPGSLGNGCDPAPVATPSSGSLAPESGYSDTTSLPAASAGGCGGTTPYEGGGQCWAIPYDIVACESGGSYTSQNSSSGAYGAYQLLGHGEYAGMPPAEQDQIASDLYAGGAGRDNWVC